MSPILLKRRPINRFRMNEPMVIPTKPKTAPQTPTKPSPQPKKEPQRKNPLKPGPGIQPSPKN
jgi:hypothetical protein